MGWGWVKVGLGLGWRGTSNDANGSAGAGGVAHHVGEGSEEEDLALQELACKLTRH